MRGIYLWTVRRPGKVPVVYIGQAKVIERRRLFYIQDWAKPTAKAKTNVQLKNAVLKYGPAAVSFRVLEEVEELERLTERERHWYWHYKALEELGHAEVANYVVPGDNPMNDPAVIAARNENAAWREGARQRALEASRSPRRNAAVVAARAKTFIFRSPEGRRVEVYNLSSFCREQGLVLSGMHQVATGTRAHHKGWTRHEEEQ